MYELAITRRAFAVSCEHRTWSSVDDDFRRLPRIPGWNRYGNRVDRAVASDHLRAIQTRDRLAVQPNLVRSACRSLDQQYPSIARVGIIENPEPLTRLTRLQHHRRWLHPQAARPFDLDARWCLGELHAHDVQLRGARLSG